MADASSNSTWPNPLRTPLLIAAAVAALIGYTTWVGGTGGIAPYLLQPEDDTLRSSLTIGWALESVSVAARLLLVVALVAAACRAGWRDTKSGLRFALGSGDSSRMAGAARFWTTAARVTVWGSVILGLAKTVAAETLIYRAYRLGDESGLFDPGDITVFCVGALFTPLFGILIGRIVFGLLAGAARIRADEPRSEPVFSRVQDVALAALVVIPWYVLMLITWKPVS